MDHDVLMYQMEERFREEFAKALKAMEDAPDGHGSTRARWPSEMQL